MLPLLSVTVQVTVVVPTGKIVGASLVTVSTPQLSVVVGDPITRPAAPQSPGVVFALISAGQVMVGL